ncbi:MAG: PHP domain-containing protein [bacterium]|nr:PHP domain-containing protein [bacterium]
MTFVPLFCQSHHSPRGVAAPSDLVRRARSLDYHTLGLCDEATIAGFSEFDEAAAAHGIRPVFGCRLFMEGLAFAGEVFPTDFLIETEQGYRNLVRLLTRYHNHGLGEPRPLTATDMGELVQGLVAVIPPDGEMVRLVALRDRARTEAYLKRLVELFPMGPTFGISSADMEGAGLIHRLARFINARALGGTPVRYPEPGDAAAETFLANPGQAPGRSFHPLPDLKGLPALWPEVDVLARWKGDLEELPHEAGNVARRCTWRPGCIRRAFPTLDLERGFDPNSYLFDLVIRGATQRYGEINEARKQRINRELEEIKASNLAPYLLLCHQIAGALDEQGISRGVGRGRLVSSMIAYCLGISRLDPLKYNLLPKTLMVEGENYPPIHIEVPRNGAARLLAWLRETYGEDHLVEIGRVQETRRDQMINDLAQWAGMTDDERRLAHREKARLRSAGAAQRLGELAEGARSRRWRDPAFLGDLAARLAPRPRGWVGHGDRYALCGEPLECVVPCLRSTQDRPVSGLEERAIDRLGLARIVFVPHGLLDILDQAMRAARAQNPSLDFRAIPLEDRATFELLGRGDTSGIPPLEGVTLRCLLRRTPPGNLLQLLRTKTEARRRGEGERPPEVSDELPDVLLSYQCAYLKTNYPLAFYAAAIGTAIEQHENPVVLVREARRAGFDVHPPDINLSDWGTSVHGGIIRLGLSTVRNFGRKAWENVQSVRSGGNFTSLANFCERVDTRIINLKILRSLITAGAMDCLDENRASMDAVVSRLQRQMREREAEAARAQAQATLFDLEAWAAEQKPREAEVESIDEWNPWEKLEREADALGFHLSVDPIHRFKIALSHLVPLQVDALAARHIGKAIRVAGLAGGDRARQPPHRTRRRPAHGSGGIAHPHPATAGGGLGLLPGARHRSAAGRPSAPRRRLRLPRSRRHLASGRPRGSGHQGGSDRAGADGRESPDLEIADRTPEAFSG